jgi:hypothetical protein
MLRIASACTSERPKRFCRRGGLRAVLRLPDDPHHFVDVVERHEKPLEHVTLGLGLLELVTGPAHHDLDRWSRYFSSRALSPSSFGSPWSSASMIAPKVCCR